MPPRIKFGKKKKSGPNEAPSSSRARTIEEKETNDHSTEAQAIFLDNKCQKRFTKSINKKVVISENWLDGEALEVFNQLAGGQYASTCIEPNAGYGLMTNELLSSYMAKNDQIRVYVLAKWVEITSRVINAYYRLPDYDVGTTDLEIERAKRGFYNSLPGLLGRHAEWKISEESGEMHFPQDGLFANARLMLHFVRCRVAQSKHQGTVYRNEASLVWALLNREIIDMGREMMELVCQVAQVTGSKGAPFPSLLSTICIAAGVNQH